MNKTNAIDCKKGKEEMNELIDPIYVVVDKISELISTGKKDDAKAYMLEQWERRQSKRLLDTISVPEEEKLDKEIGMIKVLNDVSFR